MFAAPPSPIMDVAFGRLHKGDPPTFVDSIVREVEAAKSICEYLSNIYACVYLTDFSICFPHRGTGAT